MESGLSQYSSLMHIENLNWVVWFLLIIFLPLSFPCWALPTNHFCSPVSSMLTSSFQPFIFPYLLDTDLSLPTISLPFISFYQPFLFPLTSLPLTSSYHQLPFVTYMGPELSGWITVSTLLLARHTFKLDMFYSFCFEVLKPDPNKNICCVVWPWLVSS